MKPIRVVFLLFFQDNKIFLLYDADEGDLASLDDIKAVAKDCFDTGEDVEDRYCESYIEMPIVQYLESR